MHVFVAYYVASVLSFIPKVQGVLEYRDLHFQRSALICMSEYAESHRRSDPCGNM